MNLRAMILGATAGALALAGCVQMPTGPEVRVMPAPYKPFELFEADDAACRDFAHRRLEPSTAQAQGSAAAATVTGAAVGAAAGGLIGGSQGAATGAGVGLVAGSLGAAGRADQSSWSLQRRYDFAYEQCMYAKGNQVPGYAPVNPPPPPPPVAPPPPPASKPSTQN